MKLGILSCSPGCYSTRRLLEAANQRGHEARVLDTLKFAIDLQQGEPDLFYRQKQLAHYDAVLPRIGASITYFGTAVVRQFEQMDVYCANTSASIATSRDKLRSLQILSRHRIGIPRTTFVRDKKDVLPAIERVGGAPVIIKLLEGTQGIGVLLAESVKSAEAIIELLQSQRQNVLIQKFVAESKGRDVRVRPPYPTQEGLFNLPTVVNNVETSATLYYILKNGGDKYASLGTGKSTGSKLVCLDGLFNQPGMYEIEMGTPLSVVVNDFGKGFRKNVKAIQVGGPLGGIVPVHKIGSLTLDFESFSDNGFLLGHAGVVSIPEGFPMIKYLEHLFEFTAVESCGKCYPCSIGSVRGMELVQKAQKEDFKIDRKLMDDLLETLEIGSLCALGGGLPLGVKNALQYFDQELKAYFA